MLNRILLVFFCFFLFLVLLKLTPPQIYAANNCTNLGTSICSNSYYPPSGYKPNLGWGYACENSTNTSLQQPYCYDVGSQYKSPFALCGLIPDAYGSYAGCMQKTFANAAVGGFTTLWSGACPSGYSYINPSTYGVSAFADCISSGANQGNYANENCCIRSASAPPPTCNTAVNGYCSNTIKCSSGYVINSNSYECNTVCCRPQQCSDVGGTCTLSGRLCPAGYVDYNNGTLDSTCGSLSLCCVPAPACTTGAINCTACTGGYEPTNTCGTTTGSQTCTHNQPQTCTNANFTQKCAQTYIPGNCSANYTCPAGAGYQQPCITTIHVHAYVDYNHDGVQDNGEPPLPGVEMDDNGYITYTDNLGNATDANTNLTSGVTAYVQMSVTNPFNGITYQNATEVQSITLTNSNGGSTLTYAFVPVYTMSGTVFQDTNKNQQLDNGETGYRGGTITITNGPTSVNPITVAANGTWTAPTNLLAGSYIVSYASALPAGYTFTTPSTFAATVGNPAGSPACNAVGSKDAVCGGQSNGSIANLDFGVTNENSWSQSVCFDVRNDSGSYTDQIPAAPSCGGVSGAYNSITNADCSTGAGIIFTCDATPDFGLGSANANAWQSGGTGVQQECFVNSGLNVIRTSYNYLLTTLQQSGITPTDMTTVCGAGGLANCTLPANLTKGVYLANGDVSLNAYTFPVDPSNPQGFVFLINGTLSIQGNILVPAGSVAAFSASGNISVDKSVGNVITNTSDPAVNNPNIEGLYSADNNFIIQSYGSSGADCNADGTPKDKKLNIVGSLITNAAQNGGALINNRDLCIYDLSCSSLSVGDGLGAYAGTATSYLLTLYADGKFLNHKLFNWEELKP